MRITKIILISLVSLLILFFTIGVIFPSYKYTNEVTINATKEECWEMLNNPNTMHQWMDGLTTYELVEGEHLKVGGTYKLVIAEGDEKMEMIQKIEEVNSPSMIHNILTNDVLISNFTYSLTEIGGITTLRANYQITGNSILWASVLRLSKGYISEEGEKQLQKLKNLIESNK